MQQLPKINFFKLKFIRFLFFTMLTKIFRKNIFSAVTVFAFVFSVFLALEFNPKNPYFSGYDSFYHVGMAELIMEEGFVKDFPYLFYTTINKDFSNNHLLFHVLLIPFIVIFGNVIGPKVFIAFTTALIFALLFLILRRLNFAWALPFTLIAFLLEPSDFYFRLAFVRDPTPSLLFLLLGFFFLLERRVLALSILAFLYGWLYTGGGFLFLIALIFIYEGLSFLIRKKINWKIIIFPTVGSALSLVINPYFPDNIQSIFLQIFQTGLQAKKYSGGEWYPYDTWFWFSISYIPFSIWIASLIFALRNKKRPSIFSLTVTVFSIFLLVLTWKSKRFIEYWPFFAIFSAILLSGKQITTWTKDFWNDNLNLSFKKHKLYLFSILLILIFSASFSTFYAKNEWQRAWRDTSMDYDVTKAQEAHEYLKKNSQKGDIVFTDDWDVFPLYFFLNRKNYYIVGLDPEFMNQFDPKLYKQFADISSGNDGTNLERIRDLFKAKWVILKIDHPDFLENLRNRKDLFGEVFKNNEYFIFKVKDPA